MFIRLQEVGRARHSQGGSVQPMRVDHHGPHVAVAEELLYRVDVGALFQEVRGE